MPDRLDDPQFVLRNDTKGMMQLAEGFPDQCREALGISMEADIPQTLAGKSNVVIAGMGGSAAGGDFVRRLFEAEAGVPCIVVRDYTLPSFVDSNSLVIACSYSGNTEETLSATRQALKAGASVLAITSGGELSEMAKNRFPVVTIPSGLPPRFALGYLFVPVVDACARLGYVEKPDFQATFAELEACKQDWNIETKFGTNPTKALAAYLYGRLPVVYGLGSWQAAVANRWCAQINENAKVMAFANAFPELNHNEIMGWTLADHQSVGHWAMVILEDGQESVRMHTRAKVTRDLVLGKTESFTVTARGETLFDKILTLAHFADYVSLYLAAFYGVDPHEIRYIDTLKNSLKQLD